MKERLSSIEEFVKELTKQFHQKALSSQNEDTSGPNFNEVKNFQKNVKKIINTRRFSSDFLSHRAQGLLEQEQLSKALSPT